MTESPVLIDLGYSTIGKISLKTNGFPIYLDIFSKEGETGNPQLVTIYNQLNLKNLADAIYKGLEVIKGREHTES